MPSNRNSFLFVVLAVAATAVLGWFGSGLHPLWWLMFLAPIPVLLVAASDAWWPLALVAAFAGWALGGFNTWNYLVGALHMPVMVWATIIGVQDAGFAATAMLFRWLSGQGRPWAAAWGFAAAWVSFEYLGSLISPHGTAASLAYTQVNCLPILQLASVTGPWAISFLVMLVPGSLAAALRVRALAPARAIRIAAVALAIFAMVIIGGTIRIRSGVAGPPVRIGLVASDQVTGVASAARAAQLFRDYAAQARALAAGGSQAIVLPEKIGVVTDNDDNSIDQAFQSVADENRVPIVVGMVRITAAAQYNRARVFLPGAPAMDYDKQHMLPPFESQFVVGHALAFLREPSAAWGVAICKDMDFTSPGRDYGRAGVGLLLGPAWDFSIDAGWHERLAVMRGVEGGYSVARSARRGNLMFSDPYGRILAEQPSSSGTFSMLVAEVPVAPVKTIYARFGDWFAWASIAIFLLVLLRAAIFRSGVARKTETPSRMRTTA